MSMPLRGLVKAVRPAGNNAAGSVFSVTIDLEDIDTGALVDTVTITVDGADGIEAAVRSLVDDYASAKDNVTLAVYPTGYVYPPVVSLVAATGAESFHIVGTHLDSASVDEVLLVTDKGEYSYYAPDGPNSGDNSGTTTIEAWTATEIHITDTAFNEDVAESMTLFDPSAASWGVTDFPDFPIIEPPLLVVEYDEQADVLSLTLSGNGMVTTDVSQVTFTTDDPTPLTLNTGLVIDDERHMHVDDASLTLRPGTLTTAYVYTPTDTLIFSTGLSIPMPDRTPIVSGITMVGTELHIAGSNLAIDKGNIGLVFDAPETAGGLVQTMVEGSAGQNEVQHISLGGAVRGTFTLDGPGNTGPTAPIAWDCSQADFQAALLLVQADLGPTNRAVSGVPASGEFNVEFVGSLHLQDVGLLTIDDSDLWATTAPQVDVTTYQQGAPAVNRVQHLSFPSATSGTFTLTIDTGTGGPYTTDPINFATNAGGLGDKIAALPNVNGAGNVNVTGGGGIFDIELVGTANFIGYTWTLTADDTLLFTGTAPDASVTTDHQGDDGHNERSTITVDATSGTFSLTFDGQTTSALGYAADATAVYNALVALSNIDAADVEVSGDLSTGMLVIFSGAYAKTDVPDMTGTDIDLLGGTGLSVVTTLQGLAASSEIQRVTITDAVAGTFTLTFDGSESSAINIADAADPDYFRGVIKAALEACTTIDVGDVDIATITNEPGTLIHTVTFLNALGLADQPIMTIDFSALTGTHEDVTVSMVEPGSDAVNEIETVTVTNAESGDYYLTINLPLGYEYSNNILLTDGKTEIEAAIITATSLDPGDVDVTIVSPDVWRVEFKGAVAGTDLSPMFGHTGNLIGPAATAEVTTQTPGVPAVNEVQRFSMMNAGGGTFRFFDTGEWTQALAYDISTESFEANLEALATIGAGNVSVSEVQSYSGFKQWDFEFIGALAALDHGQISADVTTLIGWGAGSETFVGPGNARLLEQTRELTRIDMDGLSAGRWVKNVKLYYWDDVIENDDLYLHGPEAQVYLGNSEIPGRVLVVVVGLDNRRVSRYTTHFADSSSSQTAKPSGDIYQEAAYGQLWNLAGSVGKTADTEALMLDPSFGNALVIDAGEFNIVDLVIA